ncbi:MAG: fructose-bisphosphate aldolase [Candidatus Eremiobacteraeota bacterium]|nr:fructose-bisphosphate aldolase [Candidatus Eremiobacteraeota bacterium]
MARSQTMTNDLAGVAQLLVSGGRGIMVLDEPPQSCNARFARLGIAPTAEQRRAYRELLIDAPGIERYVSGAVLDDETIRRGTADGRRFVDVLRARGIVPGIRLEASNANLAEYAALGAGIAAMRGDAPTLARFAARCQQSGIVPVIEPDVPSDGEETLEECAQVTSRALRRLFAELAEAEVAFEALILTTNMIAPGTASGQHVSTADVVSATLRVLGATVPVAVAGVAFVAGAQHDHLAAERLCALNKTMPRRRPWPLTFTYDRALQQAVLVAWRGRAEHTAEAQRVLLHRAHCNGLAACGAYTSKIEDQFETFVPPLAA